MVTRVALVCIEIYAAHARMDVPLLPVHLQYREQIERYFVQGFAERESDTSREILNLVVDEDHLFFK